jgi:DNA-directed RNA polymerase specialized sigma24 family protein
MSHELLNHPEVLKTIRAELLRAGCPRAEVDDRVRDVVAETWQYLDREKIEVREVDRMQAIVRGPSRMRGIDSLRAKYAEAELVATAKAKQELDQAPPPSSDVMVDLKRALEAVEANQKGLDGVVMKGLAQGLSQKEIAEQHGLSHDQVRKHTGPMRERHVNLLDRRNLRYVLAIAGVAVILFFTFRSMRNRSEEANHPNPAPTTSAVPTAPPAPPPQVPVAVEHPTPGEKQQAAQLRARAHTAALAKKWGDCAADYDAADKLDPTPQADAVSNEASLCADEFEHSLTSKPR